MLFHQRSHETPQRREGGSPAGAGATNLENVRRAGEALYRAADNAIQRALTGDSLAFLHATEQEGGQ